MRKFDAMKVFIDNLERIRIERGITQVELANLLGTTQGNISRLLGGGEDIRLSRCQRIADKLGVPLVEMIEEHAIA